MGGKISGYLPALQKNYPPIPKQNEQIEKFVKRNYWFSNYVFGCQNGCG